MFAIIELRLVKSAGWGTPDVLNENLLQFKMKGSRCMSIVLRLFRVSDSFSVWSKNADSALNFFVQYSSVQVFC